MILIVDNGTTHIPDLKRFLKTRETKFRIAKSSSRLRDVLRQRYKGVIFTGSSLNYDEKIKLDSVAIDLAVLLDLAVPVLGICFGHQTIVEAFDGGIRKMRRPAHGMQEIIILKRDPLFKGLPKTIRMFEAHQDCGKEVPYNFTFLATSKRCGIEAIKHKSRPIYGVQFHPEASGEQGEKILDNFLVLCGLGPDSARRAKPI